MLEGVAAGVGWDSACEATLRQQPPTQSVSFTHSVAFPSVGLSPLSLRSLSFRFLPGVLRSGAEVFSGLDSAVCKL